MTISRMIAVAGTGSLIVIASLAPARAEAQGLGRRVSAVRDGKVRMTFASRPDICGAGNTISYKPGNRSHYSPEYSEDVEYGDECSLGPVRVVATVNAGRVERIKTYVGGRWRAPGRDVTDLGTVSTRDAVDFFLAIADNQSGKVAGEAIFPTTLADSVVIAPRLLRIARNGSRPMEVRDQAIFWMSQLPEDNVVGMLEEVLRTSKEESIQEKTIFALSQHRSGRGFAILREFAEREGAPEKLRGTAVFWLGQKRNGDNGQYLRTLYSRVRSEELKDKIIFSISQQKGPESEEWLLGVASNAREPMEMRKKALFWAGQGGASIDRLASLYSRSDREIKDQLIFVFSQRRERAAIDKLMDIARNDPDREMRRKALFWLGQSKDARVSAFIADIINR